MPPTVSTALELWHANTPCGDRQDTVLRERGCADPGGDRAHPLVFDRILVLRCGDAQMPSPCALVVGLVALALALVLLLLLLLLLVVVVVVMLWRLLLMLCLLVLLLSLSAH